MNVTTISIITFLLIFGSCVLGLIVQRILPDHHLSDQSKEILKASRGVIIGVAALTLGLLISAAKTSFDTKTDSIRLQSAKIITISRILTDYGPEADSVKLAIRTYVTEQIKRVENFFVQGVSIDDILKSSRIASLRPIISELKPKSPHQEFLKSSALHTANEIEELRWRNYEELGSHLQFPIFIVLVFWLMCIFFSLGIVAPLNYSVIAGFFLSALSMTGAIFLMLELDRPYHGLITISSQPLKIALKVLNVGL